MTWRITGIDSLFLLQENFTVDPVFNKQHGRVVTFRNDVSEHRRVPTNKHLGSISPPNKAVP